MACKVPTHLLGEHTPPQMYVRSMFGLQATVTEMEGLRGWQKRKVLARYNADGQLLAAQRLGGSALDKWFGVSVGNDRVYAGGISRSTNGDFPAGRPGKMSAFVPADPLGEVFVMQLETAAPIVPVAETDISIAPGDSVTLAATTSPGPRIAWYDKDGVALTDPEVNTPTFTPAPDQLLPGVNQFSAVATDDAGRIGMAGVVVTVAAAAPVTKFYVVNDATANQSFEYSTSGSLVESYNLNTGNTTPRGAASNADGTKTWVVDANRKVYVYNNSGGLLGSWTAGSLSTKAKVEGITVYGSDVWIVDDYSDKVYKYAGGAALLSGSPNATSSFNLNSANTSPNDIVTDGVSLWVVNDSTTDKVFKYTTAGALVSNWTITTAGATSPTGITIDPANISNIWIVDSWTDSVYQYNAAVNFANGSSHAADVAFALAAGNTNPQGIADPPAPGSLLATETAVLAEPVSAETALRGNDAALENMYYEPVKKFRVDTVQRSESRVVESPTRDLSYTVGASANRLANDSVASDQHHTEVDDLFAQWDYDPLELLSFPDLGA
ncbi:MAG: NHL repeat-containing protein [Pirellulaceae bacterium]